MAKKTQDDGGYYAIKGFLYQFDKTIIEILNNKQKTIECEEIQDISCEEFVLQVKHKETQAYMPAKIRKAILQLLKLHKQNPQKKYRLYCYFKDQSPQSKKLKASEINQILGANKRIFSKKDKNRFIKNFNLEFSEDYKEQFKSVIANIQNSFSVNRETAITHHSIIRSFLLNTATKNTGSRKTNFVALKKCVEESRRAVFYSSYADYLGTEKYLLFLKKEYFTFKAANINCVERLFMIEVNDDSNVSHVVKIIQRIGKKYFRPGNSPAPYVCLLKGNFDLESRIKRKLIDAEVFFNDGTYFNGDLFRANHIAQDLRNQNKLIVKIISESQLPTIQAKVSFEENYALVTDISNSFRRNIIVIQLDNISHALKMIG